MTKESKALPINLMTMDQANRNEGKPFRWVAVLYGMVGSLIVLGFTPEPYLAFTWFALYYGLVLLNLFLLSKVVAVVINLMSHQGTEKGPFTRFHVRLYGGLKLITLGTIILSVWMGSSAPKLSMILGLGTMIVIPLFGGFWMSQRNLEHA